MDKARRRSSGIAVNRSGFSYFSARKVHRPRSSRVSFPALRMTSRARTISRPSRLPSAAISSTNNFGPSAAPRRSRRTACPRVWAAPGRSVRAHAGAEGPGEVEAGLGAGRRAGTSDGSSGRARKPPRRPGRGRAGNASPAPSPSAASEKMSMSGSTTNTFLILASEPNAARMALRASPGTRWRSEMRMLNMPPETASRRQ